MSPTKNPATIGLDANNHGSFAAAALPNSSSFAPSGIPSTTNSSVS